MGILPLYVAQEKGFFAEEGITLEWQDVRDPGQAGKLFFSGNSDILMTTFANLLPAEARQPGTLKLVYPICETADRPGSYILVGPNSPIKTLEDLRGKTLGTYSGPSQKAYALLVLEALGFREPDDVRLMQVESSSQVQSLFGGAFDALFTVETYGSTAIHQGAKIIAKGVRTKYISDPFWLGSVAVHRDLAVSNPSVVRNLLSALKKAAEYIEQNEREARTILARRTGTQAEVADTCALYKWVAEPSKEDILQIQQHANLLVKQGLLPSQISVRELFEIPPHE